MSLQLAAQHLSDHGRGPDDTLVHMSRKEVKSLNDLAMAHGGQLTINPQTGLPEAGFLSSILPMVAGAGLMAVSGGAINPMTAGLLVGGGSYLMNPNKGLMGALSAGLGAYGGAGLAGGLSGLATSEAGASVQNLANEGVQQEVARQTAQQQAQQQLAMNSGYANIDPGVVTPSALPADQLATIKSNIVNEQLLAKPLPTGFDAIKQGAQSLYDNPTADKFKAIGGGSYSGLARMGLAAAAPAAGEQAKFTPPPTSATAGKQVVPHYKFSPGAQTPTPTASPTGVENVYFKPQYTALSDEEAKQMYPGYGAYVPPTAAANGGLMGYAGGGPVEQMSNDNAIGANTGFPQAYLHNNAYATPYQTPISQNVLTGAGDVSVDPYTGEQRMAAGGVSYDPQTQRYTGGIADALPANTDVNIYNDTGGPASGGGPSSASSSSSSSNGSPTGSTIGDIGYAISNQSISPMAAAIAGGLMDALSSTSVNSVNATNGMDVASDAASAASAAAAAADASGGAPGMGGGSDASSGDSGAAGGGGGGAADARGGYLSHGRFDQRPRMAMGGISDAGYNLGGYSDGGRLLRGPGDGVSDSIPAVIGKKQPARLADGEFVVPARIVSELGNGSTEAGARKLYAMMDRIQAARGKTVGKGRVAKNSRSEKYLPA
jgi:hypothetical protein